MSIQQFVNQSIEQIVLSPNFISASTQRNPSLYWEITMKAELKDSGYYFMDIKIPHETCILYKLIQL
jgi:hypothetical protein